MGARIAAGAGRAGCRGTGGDIRPGRRFTDVRGDDADPALIAAVDCDLPGDAPADTLSYQWYETVEDADAAYDAVVAHEESFLQSDGCGAYERQRHEHRRAHRLVERRRRSAVLNVTPPARGT